MYRRVGTRSRRLRNGLGVCRDRLVNRWRYRSEQVTRGAWETAYAAGDWERLRDVSELARYSQIVGYCVHFKPGGAVLDIGCGEGILQEKLLPYGYRRYVGVDIAGEAIVKASIRQDATTDFLQADASDFVIDERFDIVIFNECLNYFGDPIALLRRYEARLLDDGLFVVSMYRVGRTDRIWDMLKPVYRLEDGVRMAHESGRQFTVRVLRPLRRDGEPTG